MHGENLQILKAQEKVADPALKKMFIHSIARLIPSIDDKMAFAWKILES